jgi:hypothetical protein
MNGGGGKSDVHALFPPLKRRRGNGGGRARRGIRALAAGQREEKESVISSVASIERGDVVVGAVARIGRAGGGAGVAVGVAQGSVEAGGRRRGGGGRMTRRGSGGGGRNTAAKTEEGAAAGVVVGVEKRKGRAESDVRGPRLLHLLFLRLPPRHEDDKQTMTEKKEGRRKRRWRNSNRSSRRSCHHQKRCPLPLPRYEAEEGGREGGFWPKGR